MRNDINHDSITPLYTQIANKLSNDISNGRFSKTSQLPSELELSEEFRVSRITIRRAINELVNLGLVDKKQGKGTFIQAQKMSRRLDSGPISFSEMCSANGLKAKAKILEAQIVRPESQYIQDLLMLRPDKLAVRIRRIRYAENKPIVLEDNFFPIEYSYLLAIDLEHESLYQYLREKKGVVLKSASMSLKIVRANAELAELLEVPRNAPQLELKGYVVQQNNQVVHSSYQVGYGENFEFIVR